MLQQLLYWNVCDMMCIDPFRAARNWIMGWFSCSYVCVFRRILTHLMHNQFQAANYPIADKDTKQNLFLGLGWVKIVSCRDESALAKLFWSSLNGLNEQIWGIPGKQRPHPTHPSSGIFPVSLVWKHIREIVGTLKESLSEFGSLLADLSLPNMVDH